MIVVDSAAVIDALTAARGVEMLRERLAAEEIHAPSLIDFEVVSVARKLILGGHLSAARAEDLLGDFDDLPLHRWSFEAPLRRRAFQLRHIVSAYDAAYVVLAEALECPLITRDARLARSHGHQTVIEVL